MCSPLFFKKCSPPITRLRPTWMKALMGCPKDSWSTLTSVYALFSSPMCSTRTSLSWGTHLTRSAPSPCHASKHLMPRSNNLRTCSVRWSSTVERNRSGRMQSGSFIWWCSTHFGSSLKLLNNRLRLGELNAWCLYWCLTSAMIPSWCWFPTSNR